MECDFDKKVVEDFVAMVREIAEDVYRKMGAKSEGYYNGIVISVNIDNNTATVDIGDMVLEDLPNKTGETLYVTNKEAETQASFVRVYTTSPTMTDAYVGVKLN